MIAKVSMTVSVLHTRQIALGRKTSLNSSRLGEGANVTVEVRVRQLEGALFESAWLELAPRLDHRLLGVDVDLGIEPYGASLARWLHEALEKSGLGPLETKLLFGDGRGFSWSSPSRAD